MKTEKFEGNVSAMKIKNQFLSAEDFEGMGDVELTIEEVYKHENVKTQDGQVEPIMFSVKFKGGTRELWLNATNRKAIVSQHSANTKNWRGKKVMLYVKDGIRNPKGGATVKGLRIKIDKGSNAAKKL